MPCHDCHAFQDDNLLFQPDSGKVNLMAGGFPSSSYKDTNYWVDVRFVPSP